MEGLRPMSEGQLEFLEKLLAEEIGTYTWRRDYNRRLAFRFSLMVSALSAIATVLIGTSETFAAPWLRVLAMAASAAATVFAAWEAIFGNRKLWQMNNSTLADLYELSMDINFRKSDAARPQMNTAEVEAFYGRYKKVARAAEDALKAVRTG
jgi:hypothetical protein